MKTLHYKCAVQLSLSILLTNFSSSSIKWKTCDKNLHLCRVDLCTTYNTTSRICICIWFCICVCLGVCWHIYLYLYLYLCGPPVTMESPFRPDVSLSWVVVDRRLLVDFGFLGCFCSNRIVLVWWWALMHMPAPRAHRLLSLDSQAVSRPSKLPNVAHTPLPTPVQAWGHRGPAPDPTHLQEFKRRH